MKIDIKKNTKKTNEYKLEIAGTAGWMLAIRHALLQGQLSSPLAAEILEFFDLAVEKSGLDLNRPF